ncbi:hypothetical protein WISP_103073 [Willisornis vidua]|uniref:Uncharacterized protein n=1 Tax=Willisornis vidua TaxID=1566151 RepID=A0ABQ9CY37_9PASS|nr:hypothetical protein WISP_103073 [Willisornis vidua]
MCQLREGKGQEKQNAFSTFGRNDVDHYPLDMTIQPLSYPSDSPLIKSICLQCSRKEMVEDHVKGFAAVQPSQLHERKVLLIKPDFLYDKVTYLDDQGKQADGFFYFSKAFNTISHRILLDKMSSIQLDKHIMWTGYHQEDLDKFKKYIHGNLIGFNKTKYKVLHLDCGTPQYQYRLVDEQIKSNPAKKDLWVLVDERLDMT